MKHIESNMDDSVVKLFITLFGSALTISTVVSSSCKSYDFSYGPDLKEFVGLGLVVSDVLEERLANLGNFSKYD